MSDPSTSTSTSTSTTLDTIALPHELRQAMRLDREAFVNQMADRLGRIWDVCNDHPDAARRIASTTDVGQAWEESKVLADALNQLQAGLQATGAMLEETKNQRDLLAVEATDLREEVNPLRSLQRAVKGVDLNHRDVRALASDIIKGQREYAYMVEEMNEEDHVTWLVTRLAITFGVSRNTAADLADFITHDWMDVPPELAQQLFEAADSVRKYFRGWD